MSGLEQKEEIQMAKFTLEELYYGEIRYNKLRKLKKCKKGDMVCRSLVE